MHISEGVLSAPVLGCGFAVAAAGMVWGLRRMDYDELPEAAMLSATFFVVTLIHVPIGPASVHLIMNGLLGILLGWSAFPAIAVGLLLQTLMFQYGGLTTLGVNIVNMALPAVVCRLLFRRMIPVSPGLAGFLAGFLAVGLSAVMVAFSLYFSEEAFVGPAKTIVVAHLPVMVIEGVVSAFCLMFLKKVKPEILEV